SVYCRKYDSAFLEEFRTRLINVFNFVLQRLRRGYLLTYDCKLEDAAHRHVFEGPNRYRTPNCNSRTFADYNKTAGPIVNLTFVGEAMRYWWNNGLNGSFVKHVLIFFFGKRIDCCIVELCNIFQGHHNRVGCFYMDNKLEGENLQPHKSHNHRLCCFFCGEKKIVDLGFHFK
ncbi:hypothetical protein OESDEN_14220, partial [Oesophagostomum dentatum]